RFPGNPVEFGLVGDVADRACLGTAAEQGPLRALENLNALHVNEINVVVSRRELHRLIVEVQADVRKRRRSRLRLVAGAATTEAAQEDVSRARPVTAE